MGSAQKSADLGDRGPRFAAHVQTRTEQKVAAGIKRDLYEVRRRPADGVRAPKAFKAPRQVNARYGLCEQHSPSPSERREGEHNLM